MEITFNFSLFFAALGLACVLEALPWLIAPKKMREFLLALEQQSEHALRIYGSILLILGLFVLWLVL